MNTSSDTNQIRSRMENTRTIEGILIILGWVFMVLGVVVEGITADLVVWVIAIFVGTLFWSNMKRFLLGPDNAQIRSMRTIFNAFVVSWIAGIATTYLVWGQLYLDTVIGIFLALAATYFMNQFISDGKLLLITLDQSQQDEA